MLLLKIVGWLIVCLIVLSIVLNIRKRGFRSYIINLLISIDQFFNAILGGSPDETISSRCGRGQKYWYWKCLAWILNKIDKEHCIDALNSEREHLHQPAELR